MRAIRGFPRGFVAAALVVAMVVSPVAAEVVRLDAAARVAGAVTLEFPAIVYRSPPPGADRRPRHAASVSAAIGVEVIMPLAIVGVSVGFLLVPILWVGSFLNTVDNGLNYSINQSAREALYTPTTRNEKYKAKAFIDMFVQRFAKVLAVGVSLAMSWLFGESFAGVRYLSIVVVMLVGVWIVAARYAGAQFERFDHGA